MSTERPQGRQVPPWQTFLAGSGFSGPGRGGQVPPDQMRISDAERQQVADTLSKHYAEGRLDHSEHDERVTAAMNAKTRGDLRGLLDDLPPTAPETGGPASGLVPPPAHRHRQHLMLYVLLAVLLMATVGSWFAPWHVPWVLLFLLVFFVLRGPRRWHVHHQHRHWGHAHPHDTIV
jgi:hypothetical protein